MQRIGISLFSIPLVFNAPSRIGIKPGSGVIYYIPQLFDLNRDSNEHNNRTNRLL